ncbi:hypothetical protein G6F56_012495 [Rhizopus delemar]|nr:hypothetical protein G6F56_012495 [Rhizopus delemar]
MTTESIQEQSPSIPERYKPDHIPLSIVEDSAYSTGFAQNFRQRNKKKPEHSDYDSEDFDLSKTDKVKQRKEWIKKQERKRDWYIVLALTVWAIYIRLWKVSQPSSVVFDEVHFGGFATKYIKTRFFMDVHPPLAKMMIALVGKIVGLEDFDFKEIGKDYIVDQVPYIPMRVFCGFTGLLVVPMAYLTVRGAGHSIASGLVAALMVCYEIVI